MKPQSKKFWIDPTFSKVVRKINQKYTNFMKEELKNDITIFQKNYELVRTNLIEMYRNTEDRKQIKTVEIYSKFDEVFRTLEQSIFKRISDYKTSTHLEILKLIKSKECNWSKDLIEREIKSNAITKIFHKHLQLIERSVQELKYKIVMALGNELENVLSTKNELAPSITVALLLHTFWDFLVYNNEDYTEKIQIHFISENVDIQFMLNGKY